MTPLLPLPRYGARIGVPRLLMKDEGLTPTGTFKARGAAVGVSRAAELGVTGVAMPTNGNAGAASVSAGLVRAGRQGGTAPGDGRLGRRRGAVGRALTTPTDGAQVSGYGAVVNA
jgi:hypothetical protein